LSDHSTGKEKYLDFKLNWKHYLLVASGLIPLKKSGRRGRPPKKDAKSRNRQGT
jgi:hypothetical protein